MKIPSTINGRMISSKVNSKNIAVFFALALSVLTNQGCQKTETTTPTVTNYQIVNLVSDTSGYGATIIDNNLSNAWGIAIGPTGSMWISSNRKGSTTIYDRNGLTLLAPVAVPSLGMHDGGSPTGVVYNSTTSFMIPGTIEKSKFIYAGEHGTIHSWASGDSTHTMVDRSALGAIYKGIAIATDGTVNYLYVANFKGNNIDVFDQNFNFVEKPFDDPSIPTGFAPFNVQNIGGNLYVTYAKLKTPDNEDDESGAGNGYVNVFTPAGILIKRFASQGTLNSPWGITQAPIGFGQISNAILIGNFGDGRINVYDANGVYQGQLKDGETPISIEGLWAITFPQNGQPAGDQNQLFFAAGPHNEEHGLFGYIKIK